MALNKVGLEVFVYMLLNRYFTHFHSWLTKIALECSQHFHQLCVSSEEKALSLLRFSLATRHTQTHSNVEWNFATSNRFHIRKGGVAFLRLTITEKKPEDEKQR